MSAEDVAEVRSLTGEPDVSGQFSDQGIQDMLDVRNGDVKAASHDVWVRKAATLSTLVDISEGGSSRKNSQAYDNAVKMIDYFSQFISGNEDGASRSSRTRAITRP